MTKGGIVAVYRCLHYGGKLKIDKDARMDKLRVYDHCGSEIETMNLADFLRRLISVLEIIIEPKKNFKIGWCTRNN